MLNGEIVHVSEARGGISAQVDHVQINGEAFVLKTDTEFNVNGEKLFQVELATIGLPHINIYDHPDLTPDQMLMEEINAPSLNGPNFTNANLTKLGQTLARIHARSFDQFYAPDQAGQLHSGEWSDFLSAMEKRASKTAGTIDNASDAVASAMRKLRNQDSVPYVLCHGDVHGNNVFCTEQGLILYDNNADCLVATPCYDLAVIFGELLPGYRYGEENAQGTRDSERMEAFLDGYGELPTDFNDFIDDYVLLRLLARYPNKFVPHQDSTIKLLVDKQN